MTRRLSIRLLSLLAMAGMPAALRAQPSGRPVLTISPSSAKRGFSGTFLISLEPPSGAGLVALQWTLSAGPGVSIDVADIAAGSAAEATQKTLSCAPKGAKFGCLLAGGQKSLPAGTIAVVRYTAGAQAKTGPVAVHIEAAAGTSADSKNIEIGNATGSISIQ